ncbi:hypothetical protein E0Z10_g10226 [Xylaria hypoxylon]|uniref:Uncharacterized protein n=1 Tax=Xylaria hypoxylon TaxID=37992 RepID=A0A4Z0Y6R4_9PEZI|nr:hypothetical protein E0Z10_g10226 [Xylaria hypoxylon]
MVVSIANICWVPSHEATNGDLYTIIGDPGRHGYQISRLPAIVQNLGIPRQAKFGFLPTSLSGFKKLEPRRQQELFDHQYLNMKRGSKRCPRLGHLNLYGPGQRQRSHTVTDEGSELPDFCQDSFPSSEKERTCPLLQDRFRSIQEPVPEDHNHRHCVTGGNHLTIVDFTSANFEHQAASTNTGVNYTVAADETEIELGDHADNESLYSELGLLAGQPWFLEDQAKQTWSNLDIPMPYPESRQNSPVIGFFPDTHDDQDSTDLLGPVLDSTADQETGWIQPVIDSHFLITTPEPREMRR